MLSLVINAGYEGGEIAEKKNKHITRGRLVFSFHLQVRNYELNYFGKIYKYAIYRHIGKKKNVFLKRASQIIHIY